MSFLKTCIRYIQQFGSWLDVKLSAPEHAEYVMFARTFFMYMGAFTLVCLASVFVLMPISAWYFSLLIIAIGLSFIFISERNKPLGKLGLALVIFAQAHWLSAVAFTIACSVTATIGDYRVYKEAIEEAQLASGINPIE